MTDKHALSRTSPKGGPFIGTCMKCGMTNLPAAVIGKPWVNPGGLSQGDAIIMAIKGPRDDR